MEHLVKLLRDSYDLQENKPEKSAYWHLQELRSEIKQLALNDVVVPKGTLCCPECKSTDLKVAIHTDYNECNKCYHYWET
jgi:hypothetical protein